MESPITPEVVVFPTTIMPEQVDKLDIILLEVRDSRMALEQRLGIITSDTTILKLGAWHRKASSVQLYVRGTVKISTPVIWCHRFMEQRLWVIPPPRVSRARSPRSAHSAGQTLLPFCSAPRSLALYERFS
ncbi:hypothetical protein NDU88_004349 [Pleurodeles waltl]|uniref:Uncharacterized protein n=1 Tax=Pleurodeles waltl TaxID=8319 RepID=A0AAV7NJ71_PLEWA|nr:hypothetical protein NDU88_004349 [Pleurodeles waltl]